MTADRGSGLSRDVVPRAMLDLFSGEAFEASTVEVGRPLSSYGKFELKPMEMVDSVANDQAKAAVAKDLEFRVQAQVQPIFARWNAASGDGPAKTLIVQPRVTQLRVIHGATRVLAGAVAGDSSITMDLELRDAATGAVIAQPSIGRSASAFAGAWSFGATDQNLLDYIADIASQYLQDHHR